MADPPPDTSPQRTARMILILGCLTGISTYIVTPMEQPEQLMLASDVYFHATQSWMAGDGLYGVYPSDRPGYAFLYPPIAVLLFIPHALLDSALGAYFLQTLLNIGAALGTAFIIFRALSRRDVPVNHLDLVILSVFMLLSSYSAIQFMNGQVNLWLAFAIALGFDAMDRRRPGIVGAVFALAALLKVFPAILGIWLLRIRAYRAVAVALGTGIGGLLLGAILLGPELTITYLGDVLLGRFEGSTYDEQPTPTDNVDGIHRQLAVIWPTGGASHTVIALAIIGPLLALSMLQVDTPLRRDVAGLGVLVSILLFLPLQPLYFPLIVFPLCMLLYTLRARRERILLLVGTVLTFFHLDLESVLLGLRYIPVPDPLASALIELSATVFTFILPPTLGLWILLITCVLIQLPDLKLEGMRTAPTPG